MESGSFPSALWHQTNTNMEKNPRLILALLEGTHSLEASSQTLLEMLQETAFAPLLDAGLGLYHHHTEWGREIYTVLRDGSVWGALFF